MAKTNLEDTAKSFFTGNHAIGVNAMVDNLMWQYDDISNAVEARMSDATKKRFEDFEFALNEKGEPDGLKNYQEMIMTIADDISNAIADEAFKKAEKLLMCEDWLNERANKLLKESEED